MIIVKLLGFFILPYFTILLSLWLFSRKRSQSASLRGLALAAFLCWSVLLAAMTEGWSLVNGITRDHLQASWLVIDGILLAVLIFQLYRLRRGGIKLPWEEWIAPFRAIGSDSPFEWAFLGLLAFILITLGLVAFVYPPTNYDSFSYHLARVEHWIQNQSIAPYATAIDRQVQMPPFAEEVSLQLISMTANDHLPNFIQVVALGICLLGVSDLTRKLGGNSLQQQIAALICTSIPIVLLEAPGPQNDLLLAAFLVCFTDFGLDLLREPGFRPALYCAMGLGLAIYTKSTSYVFALPFCLYIAFQLLRKISAKAIQWGALIAAIVVLINAGQYARMIQLYSHPLGPTSDYLNAELSFRGLASNVLRNTALNFLPQEVDGQPVDDLSNYANKWLLMLHQLTGISPEDGRFSMIGQNVFEAGYRATDDRISNPIQNLLMIAVVLALVPLALRRKISAEAVWLAVCLLAGFFLYCLIFKWQPWGVRLFLPLFVLWTPLISLILFRAKSPLVQLLPIAIALAGCYVLFTNTSHPILPAKYLMQKDAIYWKYYGESYPDAARSITSGSCQSVGLIVDGNAPEYLLWHALQVDGFKGRIEHLYVTNETGAYADPHFQPCAIFVSNPQKIPVELSAWPVVSVGDSAVLYPPQ